MTAAVGRVAAALRKRALAARPGERLPSVRALTAAHGASPVTVSRALALLQEEGLIEARVGSGTFVAERPSEAAAPDLAWQHVALGAGPPSEDLVALVTEPAPGVLPLSSGYADASLQPTRALATAMARALRAPDAWARAPVAGLPELRAWFARRAGGADLQDVLLVGGGQAALRTAFQATARPGDAVLMESPTYLGATAAARALGLTPVAVPCDGEGLRTDLLEEAFARSGAKVLYCQPAFSNPAGVSMSERRRAEVLDLARRNYAFIIEDDYAADLAYAGRTPPTLFSRSAGHVIYVRSLTKSVAPSMRVAALCARGPVMRQLRASRVLDDFFVARPLQAAALELVSSSAFPRHLARLQRALGERMGHLCGKVQERLHGVEILAAPEGGYSLWLRLPAGMDDVALAGRALRAGVAVSAGAPWYPTMSVPGHLRLSVAGAPVEVLDAGLERLAAVIGL